MKQMQTAVIALALAVHGIANAATDGTPGATSTGSFTATVTANPPVGDLVEVAGLEDLTFAPITVSTTGNSGAQTVSADFCLSRNTQGPVRVAVYQSGIDDGSAMNLNSGAGGGAPVIRYVPLSQFSILDRVNSDTILYTASGQSFSTQPRGVACSVGQPANIDHRLSITIPTNVSSATAGGGGNFSGVFTLIVSPL